MINIKTIVEDYYQKSIMAFLPNICNSACEFCSVNPLVGKSTKLKKNYISNFENLIIQAKSIGFNEVRLTGGEPLIFTNFSELIKILKKHQFKYTLLTNGQNLEQHLEVISDYPPKKISISFHSLEHYEDIFKNKISIVGLFGSLNQLQELGSEVSMTIVFLPENQDEVYSLIDFFEQNSIKNIKIIYPNDPKIKTSLLDKFIMTKPQSSKIDIRITDLEEQNCLLKERGFLCVIVENLSIYNCCITLGQSHNMTEYVNEFNLSKLVIEQYKKNIKTDGFACTSYINSCPIALKKVEKSDILEENILF